MNSNGKRILHYPEQKMKSQAQHLAEANGRAREDEDDQLVDLVNRDPFVQGLLMKSGQGGSKADEK
jgi:hypothetical protein